MTADWPACACGSAWPPDAPQEGLCSPNPGDHSPDCPRGRFLFDRQQGLRREADEREALEEAASDFADEARDALLRAGDREGALALLRYRGEEGEE